MAKRTLIIGDVHGCSEELQMLWQACNLRPEDDVVLVGDLIAKGPKSAEVVRLCRARNARSVRGNHEDKLLSLREQERAGKTPSYTDEQRKLLASLSEEDLAYIESMPLWIRLPEYEALVIHAGLAPGVPVEQQEPVHLLNMRTLDADGQPSASRKAGPLWAATYKGPEMAYFGHHARAGLQHHSHALGLDTGCVYGRRLTGFILPEGRLVSVRAKKQYLDPKAPKAHPSGS